MPSDSKNRDALRDLFPERFQEESVNDQDKQGTVESIFSDPESRRNIVGLFRLLLKMDQHGFQSHTDQSEPSTFHKKDSILT